MNASLLKKFVDAQAQQEALGLLRQRQVLDSGESNAEPSSLAHDAKTYLNFSSNDYLGLSREKALIDALTLGAMTYGVGSGSSPLVTGYSHAHLALEKKLCEVTGHEAALLLCSGFSANTALMKTLFNESDTVIADKLVHASIIDGLRDSHTRFKRFLHNDIVSAERLMTSFTPSALVTESIFSMDGDIAPLSELSALCKLKNICLIVDDAHGFGVQSPPLVDAKIADIQVVTFGKALGCQGAAILASQTVIDFLVANAREYIYSTALSPANACVAMAAVECVATQSSRLNKLNQNIDYFRQQCLQASIALTESTTAIQPIVIGEVETTLRAAAQLKLMGILVGAIRPPTVPQGTARLRVTLTAAHTFTNIDTLVDGLKMVSRC